MSVYLDDSYLWFGNCCPEAEEDLMGARKKVSKGLSWGSLALAVAEIVTSKKLRKLRVARNKVMVGAAIAGVALATFLDMRASRRLSRAIA